MLGHVQVGVSCEDFLQIDEISSKVRGKKHDTILQIYSQKNMYLSVCVCMHRYVCMYACMHMQLQTLVGVFPPRSIYVLFLVVDSGDNSADIHGVPAVCEIGPLCCPAASSAQYFSLSPPALLSRLLENGGFDPSLYVFTIILQSEGR